MSREMSKRRSLPKRRLLKPRQSVFSQSPYCSWWVRPDCIWVSISYRKLMLRIRMYIRVENHYRAVCWCIAHVSGSRAEHPRILIASERRTLPSQGHVSPGAARLMSIYGQSCLAVLLLIHTFYLIITLSFLHSFFPILSHPSHSLYTIIFISNI